MRRFKAGDVVQIDPAHDEFFGGCFMVIVEPKSWGAQGYCVSPAGDGMYYYRCPFGVMKYVGRAAWVVKGEVQDDGGQDEV